MKNLTTYLASGALALALSAGAASAATLSGTFTINIYQSTMVDAAQSAATLANVAASTFLDSIVYNGDLDFATSAGNSTTIGSWLATGVGGTVFGLNPLVAALQQSKADIGAGTATTTFYDIVGVFTSGFNSMISHDDGISVFDDGVLFATSAAPTSVITTAANGFDGGTWRLIYAATNSDPSVLKVTGNNLPTPVPVPAAGLLLLGALGGLAFWRRRKTV